MSGLLDESEGRLDGDFDGDPAELAGGSAEASWSFVDEGEAARCSATFCFLARRLTFIRLSGVRETREKKKKKWKKNQGER